MAVGDADEPRRGWNLVALLFAAVGGAFVVSIFHEARLRLIWDLKSSDIITLLLAGAGLILTAVGIFVAILAFYGWSTIKRDAIAAARREAERCVDRYTGSPEFGQKIETAVLNFLQRNTVEQPTLYALLAERAREQRDMTDLDATDVDSGWGDIESEGDDA